MNDDLDSGPFDLLKQVVIHSTWDDIDVDALLCKAGTPYEHIEELLLDAKEWQRPIHIVLMLAVQALFVQALWLSIFAPFAPGLEAAKGQFLKNLE